MSVPDPYARAIRCAAHDALHALLRAPADSPAGSEALRAVTDWLVFEHGRTAIRDLAEELAVDLAEALDAIATAEGRDPLVVVDRWFHDTPQPHLHEHGDGHRDDGPIGDTTSSG
jgi:hypothetical protein